MKKRQERTLSLIVIALLLAVAAAAYFCATIPSMKFWTYEQSDTTESTMMGTLDGMTFKLVSYSGMTIPAEQTYTLGFSDGMMSAKFCNNLSGDYAYEGDTLSSGSLVATKMYCATPQNIMTFEAAFGTLFAGNGATATLEGSTLTLHNADITMVFEKQ